MKPALSWSIFFAGLTASLLLSYYFGGLYLFAILPLLYFPLRKQSVKVCPECGRETMHPAEVYCALDGARLERK